MATAVVVAGAAAPATATPGGRPGVDPRIAELVALMTVPEKFGMLGGVPGSGGAAGSVPGVPRLGVPGLDMADGPSGVRADRPATALPAPVALGATFDPASASAYGGVLGQEADALDMEVLLAPMMNLVRTPYAGRNFETLSEDPLLSAQLAAPQVSAVQDNGVIATAKHYAANNQEAGRRGIDVRVTEKALRETELAAFEAVVDAGISAVMCAYNKVDGVQACDSAELLTGVLREEWGFDGLVMTDWVATHGPGSLEAGLDVEMPRATAAFTDLARDVDGNGVVDTGDLTPAVAAALDRAVTGVLTAMDEVGLLDEADVTPERATEANAEVAHRIAVDGAVLLANDGVLPLADDDLADVALIGPTAQVPLIGGGGSARVTPDDGAVDSTVDVLGGRGAGVSWATGEELDGVVVPGDRLDTGASIDGTYTAPVTQTVTVTAPTAGAYTFSVQTTGPGARLDVEGAPGTGAEASTVSRFGAAGGSLIATADGRTNDSHTVELAAGEQVTLTLSCDTPVADGSAACSPSVEQPLQLRLAWTTPELRAERLAEAARAAADARVAVVFAYNEGTEGEDRSSLSLPGYQDELVAAVAQANPDTVVVLNTGDPVLMPWLDDVRAVLQTWYSGQEGAEATVDLLTGAANPGGKLPVTFPAAEDATPVGDPANYPGLSTDDDPDPEVQTYTEGSDVGYRWYEATGTEPLFAFGHGLSYTSFEYSRLRTRTSGDGVQVSVSVRNTGAVTGSEVPQVYLGAGTAAGVPALQLAGFSRVILAPGEEQRVTVEVDERQLSIWDADRDRWVRAVGTRPVLVGSASDDVRLSGSVRVR
ncbi:beta-glucosidase family protein [Goekera deserti]|uniref:Beta-glucosidase n=1 Tax=Goekera deserti TaxID=2497753 RepID=A0A7K3WKW3_9ACTN|nr:glycoside hydrolase family 3 C-terminal domain-containing protein [Goekera deserti]NDI50523.1 beta-glucosidase [Goekera deserti]NEL56163.1 beta-glucosidase [Goekera deserti]